MPERAPGVSEREENRHVPSAVFFLVVLCIASVYWIGIWAVAPGTTLDEAILFRPHGDSDYLPLVSAASRLELGEASIREMAHLGVRSFPVGSVFLHATMVRLLGDVGFAIADVLLFLSFGWILYYFIRNAGITRRVAEVLAVAVVAGVAAQMVETSSRLIGHVPVTFWNSRLPRPFVTEVFVLVFFVLATRIISRRGVGVKSWEWIAIGITLALLLQSDVYQASNLAGVGVVLGAYLLAVRATGAIRGLAMAAAAVVVGCVPFFYQRFHELPDVLGRWGMFSNGHHLFMFTPPKLFALAFLVLIVLGLLARRGGVLHRANMTASATVVGVAVLISLFSGPLSLLVLGKGIQIHHYSKAAEMNLGYALVLCAGWLAQDVLRRFYKNRQIARLLTPGVGNLGFALAMVGCLAFAISLRYKSLDDTWWGRNQPRTPPRFVTTVQESLYRSSFSALHAMLVQPGLKQAEVLGTFDGQLANWWEYRGRYLYLPDIFNSTVSDQEIEKRIYGFMRLMMVAPEEFDQILENRYFLLRVLAGEKYLANAIYMRWPLQDYSREAQARIVRTSIVNEVNLELPLPEKQRLMDGYRHFDPLTQPFRKLDVIVLSKGELRQYMHPEKSKLSLKWSNDIFELWVPDQVDMSAGSVGTLAR